MSVFQNIALSQDTIKTRWREPYVTAGLNQKAMAGDTKGVVAGFKVLPNSGYNIEIQADPVLGLSVANVLDTSATRYAITLVQAGSLFLDLTAQANSTVFIALDAQYSVGSPSGAQLKVVDAAELLANLDLVVLAKVNVPAAPPVLSTHINMGYRSLSGDAITPEASAPTNMVGNGSFERDASASAPSFWTDYGGGPGLNPFVDNSVFRTGTQSMRLSSVGVINTSVACNPIAMLAGQTARVSAWIRSIGSAPITGGGGVTVLVVWLDDTFTEFANTQLEGNFTGGGTAFVQRQALVTAPAGTAAAKLVVSYNNCSGTLYVDDCEFVVRSGNATAQSAVFGGPSSIADAYHSHTAGGSYGGSPPFADGTVLPVGTIETALDTVATFLGGGSGAAKIGFTPVTPVDLTAITRVDNALNTLDDLKAGINIANLFSKQNTFTNTGTANATAITATGNGTGEGIRSTGGATGALGVWGFGTVGFAGVRGDGNGIGPGGYFVGGTSGHGVVGLTSATNGDGVQGTASGTGRGVLGTGSSNAASIGVKGVGGSSSGIGGDFTGGTAGQVGAYCHGTNGFAGVRGDGNGAGAGGTFFGGGSGPGVDSQGGNGIAYRLPNSQVIAFGATKTNVFWVSPFDFTRGTTVSPTLEFTLPGSSYARVYRTSTARNQAWSAFELPVGAVITGAWLVGYHDNTAPVATTVNVQLRKVDVNGVFGDPDSTPADCLNASPFAVTTNGGSNFNVSLTLSTLTNPRTQVAVGSRFLVEIDFASGGEAGVSEHFVTGVVVQYDYTQITR